MSGGNSSEEKTLPASAKKLTEARKKGQIAHSKEMVTAAATLAAFGYLLARGPVILAALTDGLASVPEALALPLAPAVALVAGRVGRDMLWAVVPLVGLVVAAAVLTNMVVNGGLLAALDPITPKMERINPVEGFKRIFSVKSLVELVKSLLKLAAVGTLAVLIVGGSLQALVELPTCGLACGGPALVRMLTTLIVTVTLLMVALGGLDVGLQRWLFLRDMRMSKTEQKRERKDSEGDPHIRRQHKQERRLGTVRTGLRNATFVIRGGEGAFGLRYAAPDALVPVLVARGLGDAALPLLDEARRAGIPIVLDDEAAALVAARLKVGELVKQDMFPPIIACMRQAGML